MTSYKLCVLVFISANQGRLRNERHSRAASATSNHEASQSVTPGSAVAPVGIQNVLFAEKLVPALVELFLHAPMVEKCIICPEIIQSLGRYRFLHSFTQLLENVAW